MNMLGHILYNLHNWYTSYLFRRKSVMILIVWSLQSPQQRSQWPHTAPQSTHQLSSSQQHVCTTDDFIVWESISYLYFLSWLFWGGIFGRQNSVRQNMFKTVYFNFDLLMIFLIPTILMSSIKQCRYKALFFHIRLTEQLSYFINISETRINLFDLLIIPNPTALTSPNHLPILHGACGGDPSG